MTERQKSHERDRLKKVKAKVLAEEIRLNKEKIHCFVLSLPYDLKHEGKIAVKHYEDDRPNRILSYKLAWLNLKAQKITL